VISSDLLIFFQRQTQLVDDLSNLSELDKKTILDAASGMDRIILLLLRETGLEIEDLIKLHVSDIDLQTDPQTASLVASNRKIHFSSQATAELAEYLENRPAQSYLLEGRCGKPITIKWKRCVLEPLLHRLCKRN
jgi:integrase